MPLQASIVILLLMFCLCSLADARRAWRDRTARFSESLSQPAEQTEQPGWLHRPGRALGQRPEVWRGQESATTGAAKAFYPRQASSAWHHKHRRLPMHWKLYCCAPPNRLGSRAPLERSEHRIYQKRSQTFKWRIDFRGFLVARIPVSTHRSVLNDSSVTNLWVWAFFAWPTSSCLTKVM